MSDGAPSSTKPVMGVGPVADRVGVLRAKAAGDPSVAQRDAWAWIRELGATRDGQALDALFLLGTLPQGLDGATDGLAVTMLTNPLVDLPVRQLMRLWMPWQGKIFDAAAGTGVNRLTHGAVLPARMLWPRYRVGQVGGEPVAFEFVSGVESGRIEPRIPVLKIDYQPVRANPMLIRRIRDELVEVVPDTYLGRILFRLTRTSFTNIGYFALRQPAAAS